MAGETVSSIIVAVLIVSFIMIITLEDVGSPPRVFIVGVHVEL